MQKTISARSVSVLLLMVGLTNVTYAASAPLAVKRGQTSVDRSTLPFVCLRVALDGMAMNVQEIVFEDVAKNASVTAMLAKTFDRKHPDYLTAMQGRRSAILAILRMKPGRYRLRSIEYNPALARRGVGSVTIDLAGQASYEFTVEPDCVNYVGALVIAADWKAIRLPSAEPGSSGGSAETSFQTRVMIEQTCQQDRKWAGDVVPCMRDLPSRAVPLTQR